MCGSPEMGTGTPAQPRCPGCLRRRPLRRPCQTVQGRNGAAREDQLGRGAGSCPACQRMRESGALIRGARRRERDLGSDHPVHPGQRHGQLARPCSGQHRATRISRGRTPHQCSGAERVPIALRRAATGRSGHRASDFGQRTGRTRVPRAVPSASRLSAVARSGSDRRLQAGNRNRRPQVRPAASACGLPRARTPGRHPCLSQLAELAELAELAPPGPARQDGRPVQPIVRIARRRADGCGRAPHWPPCLPRSCSLQRSHLARRPAHRLLPLRSAAPST